MHGDHITLAVNGRACELAVSEGATLLDALRGSLGLMAAKNGCGKGLCGTCVVLVNGQPRQACKVPLSSLEGAEITTLEGLGENGALHPVQRAMIEEGAIQCGFCTPGMVVAAVALLARDPNPDEAAIRSALAGHLCRCTGYVKIIEAVRRAAAQMRGESVPSPADPPRPDAHDKAAGTALYADDAAPPGDAACLHGCVVRSGRVHARLVKLDTARARGAPGVVAVLTHAEVPGSKTFGRARMDQPLYVGDVTRYPGDALCLVVAETAAEAEAAAALVAADWEDLPPVLDATAALADGAPELHPGGNLAAECRIRRGTPAEGGVEIRHELQTASVEHACLEPESALVWLDAQGQLVIRAPSQNVFFDRKLLSDILGLPPERVRVIQAVTGGAFGKREDLFAQPHAALAALVTGRPVRVRYSREETHLTTTKRHPMRIACATRAAPDGTILAASADILADAGPYLSWAPNIIRKSAVHALGPYRVPAVAVRSRAAFTNGANSGAFRGYGATQVLFAREVHMDLVARSLGLDPLAFRRRNLLREGDATATGSRINVAGLSEVLERAAARFGWDAPFRREDAPAGWVRGRGIGLVMYGIGYGNGIGDIGSAVAELTPAGRVVVRTSAVDYGQGALLVFRRLAAEAAGVPEEAVDVVTGDTACTPDSGSTVASRQTTVTGSAIQKAASKLGEALKGAGFPAADLAACARHLAESGAPLKAQARFLLGSKAIDVDGQGDVYGAYAFACQIADVAVQLDTRRVKVHRIVAVHDVGRAVCRDAIEGQIEGGIAMGLGMALMEDYRVREGRHLDLNFDTYRIPRTTDMPAIEIELVESGGGAGPGGVKGIGEPAMLPTAPAIINAVNDATGWSITQIPFRPEPA